MLLRNLPLIKQTQCTMVVQFDRIRKQQQEAEAQAGPQASGEGTQQQARCQMRRLTQLAMHWLNADAAG